LEQLSATDVAQGGCLILVPLTVAQIASLENLIPSKINLLAHLAQKDIMILWPEQINQETRATNVRWADTVTSWKLQTRPLGATIARQVGTKTRKGSVLTTRTMGAKLVFLVDTVIWVQLSLAQCVKTATLEDGQRKRHWARYRHRGTGANRVLRVLFQLLLEQAASARVNHVQLEVHK
jgi:hypothetical protein